MTRRKVGEQDLQLQGQRVPGDSVRDHHSYDDFNAYDINLYSEDSDCSSSGFLQPVPSLPGLAEPRLQGGAAVLTQAAGSSTVVLRKQDAGSPSSSSSALSPTKHQAWRQGHMQRVPGAAAGHLLQSLPAAGSLAAHHQPSFPTGAEQAVQVALPGLKLPAVASKALPVPPRVSSQSSSLKHAAGHARRQGASATCQQAAYDRAGSMTLNQVPEGVITGHDAVRFFCSGAGKTGDLTYCNLAQSLPITSSSNTGVGQTSSAPALSQQHSFTAGMQTAGTAAAVHAARGDAGFFGDEYNPYNLRAVPQQLANKQQHWVISYHGVTQMRVGEPPDLTPHPEWLRQSELFDVLKGLSFFKQWRVRTAFKLWRSVTIRLRFLARAEAVGDALLSKHSAVQATLQEAHWLCLHLSAAAVPQGAPLAQPIKLPPAAAEHPAGGPAANNQQQQEARVPTSGAGANAHGQPAPPAAVPVPLAAAAVPSAASAGSSSHSGSAGGQQVTATQPSSSGEPVWQKCAGQGRWRLLQQHSGSRLQAAVLAADASGQDDDVESTTANSIASAAANAALVDELASAAKGLLPQLQSREGAFDLVAARSPQDARREAAMLGVQEQMQAATAHLARLLKALCSVLQPEVAVTLTDLEAWRASAQAVVAKTMASLQARILGCMARLQQQLAAELVAKQAAAAAEKQAANEAGKKPLPWNIPAAFNLRSEQQAMRVQLDRVAHVVNVLVTSHAAQLAGAATAHLLSCLITPADAAAALRLCPQLQLARLRRVSTWPGVKLRLHASLDDGQPTQQDQAGAISAQCGASSQVLRLTPAFEVILQLCGGLPCNVAAAAASLELLPVTAPKACSSHITNSGRASEGGSGARSTGADRPGQSSSRMRLPSGRARNVRLETVMVACRSVEVQGLVYEVLEEQYQHTLCSSHMHPYVHAPKMLQFCSSLDVQAYMTAHPTARQLASDVETLGTWLAQLSASSHHISLLHTRGTSADGGNDQHAAALRAAPSISASCSISGSSSNGSWEGGAGAAGRRQGHGVLEVDVSTVRPVLIKAGRAALGSILTILPQAFMQCSDSLRTQLDEATATASQRPDSLEGFIAWQASMQSPASASGGQRASCMSGHVLGGSTGRGSFCGGDAVRVGLLAEVEALRTLLDVLRPGSAASGSCPDWISASQVGYSSSGSRMQARQGHINEAREAVLQAARHHGVASVKTAASTLSSLQALVMTYKDAVRAASAHMTLMGKKLAPHMAQLLAEDQRQVEDLERQLSDQLAKPSVDVAAALATIQDIQQQQLELTIMHEDHLQTAVRVPTQQVAQALTAYRAVSAALQKRLKLLAEFRTAQQAWDQQLDALHATHADSSECRQRLEGLEAAGQALTLSAKALKDLHTAKPGPHSNSGTHGSNQSLDAAAAHTFLPALSAAAVADAAAVSLLCQEVLLEVTAWQQRMPAAAQLLHPAMLRRHVLMLLALKAIADGGSIYTLQDICAGAGDGVQSNGMAGSEKDAHACALQVQQALLHHDLMRRDGYEAVFLRNIAANAGGSSGQAPEGDRQAMQDGRQGPGAAAAAAAVGRVSAGAHNSLAALLVWVSRNCSTGFLLAKVVEIAEKERRLSEQVSAVAAQLDGLHVTVGAVRVAGVFMGGFADVRQQLQATRQQLSNVWQDPFHVGVLEQLKEVQHLLDEMLSAAQACQECQEQLLRLHNICSHPALNSCLSDRHHTAVAAAAKPWASALLKLRCSPTAAAVRSSAGGACTARQASESAAGGSDVGCLAEPGGGYEPGAVAVQEHRWDGCKQDLALAAAKSLGLMHQALDSVSATVLPVLHQRWPRLGLVRDDALLQLLTELPAVFRAAWALQQQRQHVHTAMEASEKQHRLQQQQDAEQLQGERHFGPQAFLRLPQALLDALFRGVNAVQVAAPATAQGGNQLQVDSNSSSNTWKPSYAGSSAPTSTAVAQMQLLSGCAWEPLSTAELASGVGQMHIVALVSAEHCAGSGAAGCSSSGSTACLTTPLVGEVLQRLSLEGTEGCAASSTVRQQGALPPSLWPAGVPKVGPAVGVEPGNEGSSGILWTIDGCPAAFLEAVHARASQALKRELATALKSASGMPVEEWAAAPSQVLALADAVMWTKAATAALQQLAAGNSRDLRSLCDAATLRLETVSTALRRQQHTGSSTTCAPASAAGRGLLQGGCAAPVRASAAAAGRPAGGRPDTPDTFDAVLHASPRTKPQATAATTESRVDSGNSQLPKGQLSPSGDSSSNRVAVSSDRKPRQLSQQQVLGLQTLASAAASHRDVAAALVAAAADGALSCTWEQQLRHYWDPEQLELQVCWGPCQVPHGWQYCPAAAGCPAQPLASALTSGSSLLAAAAALQVSPVLGLDLTSWKDSRSVDGHRAGSSSAKLVNADGGSSAKCSTGGSGSRGAAEAAQVLPSCEDVTDVLAGIMGVQAFHLTCRSGTTARQLQTWLQVMQASAGATKATPCAASPRNSRSKAAASDDSRDVDVPGSTCTMLCSMSGIQHLPASVMSAANQALMLLRAQVGPEAGSAGRCCCNGGSGGSDGSNGGCCGCGCSSGSSSIPWPLCVLCEVPPQGDTAVHEAAMAVGGRSAAAAQRRAVLGALQLAGRCVAVQPPKVSTLLELGFRHLGLTDVKPCAAVLADLLQLAANLATDAAAAAAAAAAVAAGAATDPAEDQPSMLHSSGLQQRSAAVHTSSVRCVLRHLSGLLLQQGSSGSSTGLQPGCSAWVCLQPVVHDLLLPWVRAQGDQGDQVLEACQRAMQAAQRTGCISSTFLTQSVHGCTAVDTTSAHEPQHQCKRGQSSTTQAGQQQAAASGPGAQLWEPSGTGQQQLQGMRLLNVAPERVAAVARALCEEWCQQAQQQQQQKGLASAGCSTGPHSSRRTSKLTCSSVTAAAVDAAADGQGSTGGVSRAVCGFKLRQPVCLKQHAAAEAAEAVHRALQLHGTCLLLGPSGVGKSLVWKLLAAVYQHLQQQWGHCTEGQHSTDSLSSEGPSRQQQQEGSHSGQPGGVSWVHCFPHVLLEAAQAAGARNGHGMPVESLLQLVCSYYQNVQQGNMQQVETASTPRPCAAPSSIGWGSPAAQTCLVPELQQQGTAPPAVLVLDSGMLGKPGDLQKLLLQLLQQQAGRAVSHSPGQQPGGWGGLASCMGCIIEADSVKGVDPAPLQQLPVVVLAAPGVLDHKQQLQADVRSAFRPLPVAVGSCEGTSPGISAGVLLPAAATPAAETALGGGGAAQKLGMAAAAGAGGTAAVPPAGPAGVGCFVRGSTTQLSLSTHSSSSLSSLLEELVAAGLAVINQHTSPPPSRQAAVRPASEAASAAGRAPVAAAAAGCCAGQSVLPAAAAAAAAAPGEAACLEAGRQQLQAYQLASHTVALAGAMWSRATLGSSQMLNAGLVNPSPDSSGLGVRATSAVGAGNNPSGPHPPATAAEQLAARLLLFAASWVLSGACSEPGRQLGPLHSALLAVLSGAGYAWAAPPGNVGLLGARVSVSSGKWVPWEEDLKTVQECRVSSSCGLYRRGSAGSAQQQGRGCYGSSGEAGDGSSGTGAVVRGGESVANSRGCDEGEGQLQPYHVCSAGGDDTENEDWDVSPAAAAAAEHAAYSSGSLSSTCAPGGVFLHSERTCALQCVLYWMLQAGLSPVLHTHPGSGVASAVRHLLCHTWGVAGAPGVRQLSASARCCSPGVMASRCSAVDSEGGASRESSVVLEIPAGLLSSQAAALLTAYRLDRQVQSAPLAAGEGCVGSIKPLLLLLHRGGGSGGASCAPEWLWQVLESSGAAATRAALLPGASRDTGSAGWVRGAHKVRWVQAPAAQLVSIAAAEPCRPLATAGRASRHLLQLNCDCFAAISNSGVTPAGSLSSMGTTKGTVNRPDGAAAGSCVQGPCSPGSSSFRRGTGFKSGRSRFSKQPLVQPSAVVGVLLDRWGHLLPVVPHVPRHLLCSALQNLWCELSDVCRGLQQQQQLLPGVLSASCCCFGLPQLQSSLLQLAVLCEQAAEQYGQAGASARQQNAVSVMQMVAAVPQTPCTPAGLGGVDAVTPGSCVTLHRLGGTRLPLKMLCLLVVEVLSRTVADGAATAEQQHALHRLVVLLVVQHLAALDPSSSSTHAAAAAPAHGHMQQPAVASGSSSTTLAATAAQGCMQQPVLAASSSSSSTSSSTPRGPYLLKTLAAAVTEQQAGPEAPHSNPSTPAAFLQQQQQQQQKPGYLATLWQLLLQLTEAQFAETLREELLPAPQSLLSGRYISQLLFMAALGQDPVQLGQPLHLDAARAELSQLAVHTQAQQQQQQQQQQQAHGRALTQPLRQQQQQVWTPRRSALSAGLNSSSSRRDSSSSSPSTRGAVPAAAGTGRHTSTPTTTTSSSSSGSRPCADTAGVLAVVGAGRLLQSSIWVAAAHKLMWHLEMASARGPLGCLRGAEGYSPTSDTPAWGYPAAADGGAGAAAESQTAAMPVAAAVQSVALMSGPSVPCLEAAAAVAAAAVSCRVVMASLAELSAAGGMEMRQLLFAGSAMPAAETETGARVGWQGVTVQEKSAQLPLKKQEGNQSHHHQQQQQQQHPEDQEEEQGAGLAPVVLLVDLTAAGNPLSASAIAALQRWCCPVPWVTPGAAAADVMQVAGVAAPWMPVHLILMCAPSQRCQLDAILGPQCYRLSLPPLMRPCGVDIPSEGEVSTASAAAGCGTRLPAAAVAAAAAAAAGHASREQLEGDCKAQLMQQCSSDLQDHLQDAARCMQQHSEARGAGQHAQQHPQQQQEGEGVPQQQQQQQGPGVTAGAMPAAARRLAERLAGVLAEVHFTALEAYTRQLSIHAADACLSTSNVIRSRSIKGVDAQALPQSAGANACKTMVTSSAESRPCSSTLWSAQDLACQAVPPSKPADAVCSMQQLLRSLRQPLAARRSALAAGVAGARRYMALLRQHTLAATAEATGTDAAAAAEVAAAPTAATEATQCKTTAEAAAGSTAAGKLLQDLSILEAKWAQDLDEVNQALARLLPDALLAALQLIYLGGLPATTQQQLTTSWASLLAHAAAPESKLGTQAAAVAAAARDTSNSSGTRSTGHQQQRQQRHHGTPTAAAAAAAGTAAMQPPHAALTQGNTLQETGNSQQGACIADCIAATWDGLLRRGGGGYPIPGSVLMREAGLLQQRGLLAQQLQLAVAALDLAGRPVLVVDPLGFLLKVLQLLTEYGSAAAGAASSSGGACAGSSGRGREGTTSDSSSGSGSDSEQWVVVECERGVGAGAAAAAASAAFAGGRDVCLRLHSITTQQEGELVRSVVAAWHGAQLLQREYPGSCDSLYNPSLLSSSSSKGLRSSRSKTAARSNARQVPRLLVHVDSPCAVLPVRVAGLLGVVGIGAGCVLQNVAGRLGGPLLPPATGGVYEVVQAVLLPLVEQRGVRAALAAQQAAEEAEEEADRTESLLLKHAAQEPSSQATQSALLQSLTREARQLLQQTSATDQAADSTHALLASWQPLVAALSDILEAAASRRRCSCQLHGSEHHAAPVTSAQVADSRQLLQQLLVQLPWVSLEVLLLRATSAGLEAASQSAGAGVADAVAAAATAVAGGVVAGAVGCAASRHQAAGEDRVDAPAAAAAAAAAGRALTVGGAGDPAPILPSDSQLMSECVRAASMQLLQDLTLLLPCSSSSSRASDHPCSGSSGSGTACIYSAAPGAPQADGLVLQQLLGVVPAAVPIAVCADTSAAAVAAIIEAAAAAGLPSSCIRIKQCSVEGQEGMSATAAAAAGGPSVPAALQQLASQATSAVPAAAPSAEGKAGSPPDSSSSEMIDCCWRILLVDCAAAVPAALAAAQQLQQQQQKKKGRCRHSVGSGCDSDCGGTRVWLVVSWDALASSWRLLGGRCLLYQPRCSLLQRQCQQRQQEEGRMRDLQEEDQQQRQQEEGDMHDVQGEQEQLGMGAAAGAISVVLQAQGLSDLLRLQQQHRQQQEGVAAPAAAAAAVAEGRETSRLWLTKGWRSSSTTSSSSGNAARGPVGWRADDSSSSSSSGSGDGCSSSSSFQQLCIQQPLMVAAAVAAAIAGCFWSPGDPMSVSVPGCGLASSSQNLGTSYQAGCLAARVPTTGSLQQLSDLRGRYDWAHAKLLLQRVAAHTVQHQLRTASAAAVPTTMASSAAAAAAAASRVAGAHGSQGGSSQGAVRQRCAGSSRPLVVAESGVQHGKLPHQSFLQLDLQEVQQLLQWAVLGPGCTSQQQLEAAGDALSAAFSAEALGVRDRQELNAGVQVDGGCIADAIECVVSSRMGSRQEGGGGRWSEDSAGEGQCEVVLPLGMCLGLQEVCTLLDRRQG